MQLYYSDVLSPRKACAVARHLESSLEYIYLDLAGGEHMTPGYLERNPNGKVPTLVDGDWSLWEADAIMCYLAARCDSDLWPQDGRQIEVLRWMSWATQHFNKAAGTLYFEYIIKSRFGIGPVDPDAVEQASAEFRRFAGVLDTHLAQRRWLTGDALSVADFSVAVTLPYARDAHIPVHEFPAVERWHEQLNALEAWREPFPLPATA